MLHFLFLLFGWGLDSKRRKQESGLEEVEEETRIRTTRGRTRIWTRRGGKQESGLEEEENKNLD
jgi:hypothetical protein